MKIVQAHLHIDRSQGSSVPNIPHCAIAVLEKSGIGESFLNQDRHDRGILILHQTDLPSLQEVLEEQPWFGTKDQLPMVQFFADYLSKHPEQDCFCFVVSDS